MVLDLASERELVLCLHGLGDIVVENQKQRYVVCVLCVEAIGVVIDVPLMAANGERAGLDLISIGDAFGEGVAVDL